MSQGIEPTIEYCEDSAGWGLLVPERDYENAVSAIRQYRLENRRRPWRRDVFGAGILFDWASLAWVFLVVLFFWFSTHGDFESAGIMDSTAVAHGQWWRLFTAVWLHADAGHLATNATLGLVLLGFVMGRYGTGVGLLSAYLTGVGGNLVAWLMSPGPHRSLGASGMVLGCLGLLAVHSFALWRQTPHAGKYVFSSIVGGVMLFVLLGLTPGTDVLAHAGGFACGLILGTLLSLIPGLPQSTGMNLVSGLTFALLAVVPWWHALTHAR
jgi:rhomboid protease GluP